MSRQTEQANSAAGDTDKLPWNPRVRGMVSIFLAFHVAAVFIAPWSGPPPASGLSGVVSRGIRPYLELVNINYSYRFFAPTPGPSHIVRYRLHLRDGSMRVGQFPNLDEHWPRLLYHRHLMLSERVHGMWTEPPMPPNELPGYAQMSPITQQRLHTVYQVQGREFNDARRTYRALIEPIAQGLMREHDADVVELWAVEHSIPDRMDVVNGVKLTDGSNYLERYIGHFERR